MAKIDKKYHRLLKTILKDGRWYDDPNRKGVKRLQIPHYSFSYNLKDGFPAITTKKLFWKGVVGELLWFLRGDTNIKYLVDNGINIWNKDAYNWYSMQLTKKNGFVNDIKTYISQIKSHGKIVDYGFEYGDLGRVYGAQWRNFTVHNVGPDDSFPIYVDQIQKLIKNLKEKPLATDHIVTVWNPAELSDMALPPCHKGFQLMVYELTLQERMKYGNFQFGNTVNDLHCDKQNLPKYGFDLVWEQRSVDTFLGLPFNIASYALLAHIIGEMVNMVPGKIIGDLRNVHIYDNVMDGVKEQLFRDVDKYKDCELSIDTLTQVYLEEGLKHIDNNNIVIGNFNLYNYESYDGIKAEMLSRDN